MDLNLLCRLCAKEDRLCIQVFGTEGKKQRVAKKIRLCLPIVVKESDNLPKQICLNCLSNLDTSYELYTRCLEADSVIKNLMLVNVQSSGEMVKVYSTQEMLSMVNELKEKMCEKRPAVRLGNTVYTIRDARNQAGVSSNGEQRAKKRKEEAAKAAGRSVMYPVGQQYMLMPSASMPPAMVIPSAVPHGQFAIAPMPTIPTFPIQAVPPTAVTTAPAVATNAPAPAPQAPNVTKPGAVPSTTETAAVQQAVLPGSTITVTPTINSKSAAAPQLTSIQNAIQAFQNSSQGRIASVQPIMSTQGNSAPIIPQLPTIPSNFTLSNTTENTSSPSVTEPRETSAQQTPLPGITPLQSVTPVRTNDPEEILPLITSDNTPAATPIITKRSPRSSPTSLQQSSPQKSQSTTFMVNVSQTGDDDDDDDEYAADDPDPLQEDSEQEQQEEQEAPVVEKSATEAPSENRDESNPAIEELSSDGSASGDQVNSHKCPYCNKHFPENVIFHHKKLHFRQKFFSCIMCNKNFRTEAGLENHRCEQS